MSDPAEATGPRRRVTILQRRMYQYRLTLFDQLRRELDERNIELQVVYGQPSPTDAKRRNAGSLAWGDEVPSRWFTVRGTELQWLPVPPARSDVDLLILMQENKIVSNPLHLARRALGRGPLLGYWGHGRNLQGDPNSLSERLKRQLTNRVDWWFGYTEHTRQLLVADGYPDARITVLNNAIDNEGFRRDLDAVGDDTLAALSGRIDRPLGGAVGLYCGSLYPDKRLDLLLDVAEAVQAKRPDFRLVVVGDGPSRPEIEAAAARHPWLHWAGMQTGVDKAAWFRLADVYLSPGAVGLHVLDAFAAGVPMFTTAGALHGPEICYLEHDVNGFVLADDATVFAGRVVEVLDDPDRLSGLVAAGYEAAGRYTLSAMVTRFADGIEDALAVGRSR